MNQANNTNNTFWFLAEPAETYDPERKLILRLVTIIFRKNDHKIKLQTLIAETETKAPDPCRQCHRKLVTKHPMHYSQHIDRSAALLYRSLP